MPTNRRCRDCQKRWAQEMGLCRACQAVRVRPNTPELRRCAQCDLTPPHARCTLTTGHAEAHSFEVRA